MPAFGSDSSVRGPAPYPFSVSCVAPGLIGDRTDVGVVADVEVDGSIAVDAALVALTELHAAVEELRWASDNGACGDLNPNMCGCVPGSQKCDATLDKFIDICNPSGTGYTITNCGLGLECYDCGPTLGGPTCLPDADACGRQ